MARYQIDIQKRNGSEYWTNVYYVEVASLQDATDAGLEIVEAERTFHLNTTFFDRLRVRTAAPDDEEFSSNGLSGPGGRVTNGTPLPLFNVVRAELNASTGGRPSRKYYRGVLTRDDYGNGDLINLPLIVEIETALDGLPGGLGGALVDVDGQPISGASVFNRVGMRQLRRGSKKRQSPVV